MCQPAGTEIRLSSAPRRSPSSLSPGQIDMYGTIAVPWHLAGGRRLELRSDTIPAELGLRIGEHEISLSLSRIGEKKGEEGSLFNHQGHLPGALANWYMLTGNEQALRLSGRLVRFLTKPGS